MKSINFEWPTQSMLNSMPEDCCMRSIEFSRYRYAFGTISSVKVTLTNNLESPIFKKSGTERHEIQTITFS